MALIRASKVNTAEGSCTLKTSGGTASGSYTLSSLTKGKKYLLTSVSAGQSTDATAKNAVTVSSVSGGSKETVESPTTTAYSSTRFGHSAYLLTPTSTSMTITKGGATWATYMLFALD